MSTACPDFDKNVGGGLAGRHVEHANVEIESRAFLILAEVLSNIVVAKVVWSWGRVRNSSLFYRGKDDVPCAKKWSGGLG